MGGDLRSSKSLVDERYRQLASAFEALGEAVTIVDCADTIIFVNSASEKLYGYSREEMLGQPVALIVPRDSTPVTDQMVKSSPAERWEGDVTRVRKGGIHFPVHLTVTLLRDRDGQVIGRIGVAQDITARIEAEKAARRLALENAVLAEIGRIVSSSLDTSEVYERLAAEVSQLIPFDRIAINLISPDGKTFTSAYIMGIDIPGRRQGETMALEGSFTLKAIESRTGLLLQPDGEEDISGEIPGLAPVAAAGLRSYIAVPLVSRDRAIGVLHLASRKPMAYTQQDLVLAQSVGTQIAGAIANAQLYAEFKRADEALRRQLAAMDTSMDGIAILDENGCLLYVNNALVKMYGYDRPEELLGKSWEVLYNTDEASRLKEDILPQVHGEGQWRGETIARRRDGKTFPQEVSISTIQGGGFVCIDRDITERKRLEEQLFQSQKMEAVGRLAGGIAHDFNNLLTAVMGYAYLAMNAMPRESSMYRYLEEIQASAERAANLTNQLLAFSRRQMVKPRVVDLNDLVRKLDLILRRLIGENIEFSLALEPELWAVKVDSGQIEQVLVNLVVNARDAMPAGGKLCIRTQNASLGHADAQQHPELTPGEYVVLSVTDTGIGMTDYVKAHLFEPFFTTKPVGKGTGLGLSTCYGIIKQSGGHITAQSEVGRGASFTIHLPRAREAVSAQGENGIPSRLPAGNETVLVVEDEPNLRYLAVHILRERGYRVLEAADGLEALAVAEAHADEVIHLLVTDVVMPHMDGKQLAEQLTRLHPETRVLFTSGYTNDIVARNGMLRQGAQLLFKPYSVATLALKVREVLDRAGQGSLDRS